MSFNQLIKHPSIDMSKIFGFQITAFPEVKPKYSYLNRQLNGNDLKLYEDGLGYHLTRVSSPLEVKVEVTPSLCEKPKKCKITFTYVDLNYKASYRKEVVKIGLKISSRIKWAHKIVWFTDDGKVEWEKYTEGLNIKFPTSESECLPLNRFTETIGCENY